jgi:hypothetical protein
MNSLLEGLVPDSRQLMATGKLAKRKLEVILVVPVLVKHPKLYDRTTSSKALAPTAVLVFDSTDISDIEQQISEDEQSDFEGSCTNSNESLEEVVVPVD